MEYIYVCPKCGSVYGYNEMKEDVCNDCRVGAEKVVTVYSGYNSEDWYAMKPADRTKIKNEIKKMPIVTRSERPEGAIYSINGVRGRHIDVYEDRCVISVNAGLTTFITGNASDGEKTIYYVDCIGVQFKRAGLQIGYLQLETASGLMNNRQSNFFNENSFTFDPSKVSNEEMEEVAEYVKERVAFYKQAKAAPAAAAASPVDEIKKYKELLDMGIITQEEFDIKKHQLLGL